MNTTGIVHLLTIVLSLAVGIVVFRTNPQRATNQVFLILTVLLALWLLFMEAAFIFRESAIIIGCVRGCHSAAAFFPMTFEWLRVSIVNPRKDLRFVANSSPVWLGASIVISWTSLTPLVVEGMASPRTGIAEHSIPEPILGPGFVLFGAFYAVSLGILVWRFYRTLGQHTGIQRTELQFILLGAATSIATAFALVILPPLLVGSAQTTRFAPLAVAVLFSVIGYGIATKRIMDVAYFFRSVTAYALLTVYLVAVYLIVWWPLTLLYTGAGIDPGLIPQVLAALTVAFSLAPTHGRMQRVANRLFVHFAPMDVNAVVQSANQILQSISTVDKLLDEFAELASRAVGTDRVLVLLPEDGGFAQRHPPEAPARLVLGANDPLVRTMDRMDTPLVPDVIRRTQLAPEGEEACRALDRLQGKAAMGMRSKERLEGIVLVGPRLSGRIYGAPEQQALQLLSNQLAAALNNARLYTQVQDSKIYNDILVDSLASGVIAASNEGRITVFNREAQRLTRLASDRVLQQPVESLPPDVASLLRTALRQGYGLRDQELTLQWAAGDETPVRVSSSVFHGHTGSILGAFLVLNDLTAVKRLEMQVRRSDRLASLGTLAAGMAHEIKNPLVSIKTFTQLLPERYEDTEFRDGFLPLVGDEVRRIDSLVNQLLRFSRPSKPNLAPTHLHDILANALKLMSEQVRQRSVRLVRATDAPTDLILADGDQLSQAFINLILNALEAMPNGGTLTVATCLPPPEHRPAAWRGDSPVRPHVQVAVTDTGEGINADDMAHIFDPFFTTKSHGTGLGLSVAHGIISDHGGTVDVKSEPGRGTTFLVSLPLADRKTRGTSA